MFGKMFGKIKNRLPYVIHDQLTIRKTSGLGNQPYKTIIKRFAYLIIASFMNY